MDIRDAEAGDAGAIAKIYNHQVAHSTAVWNDSAVDAANRADWIAERQAAGYAVLVAEDQGEVLGYAAYGPFRGFAGYRLTVENSVYVDEAAQGRGVGRALMQALVARGRADGFHIMVGAIEAGNTGSIALHEALGFCRVALMPEVGQKFGRWLDLALLQLRLDERTSPKTAPKA